MSDRSAAPRPHSTPLDWALVALLVLQVVVIVHLGLTPFQFSLENQVEAVAEVPGIAFDAAGMGTSRGTIDGPRDFPTEQISLMFEIEPAAEPNTGLGTIFSLEADAGHTPLIVAQWKDWLVVRVRDPEHRSLGYWEIDAAGLSKDVRRFVTITSSPERGTVIYVDGKATGDTRTRSLIRNDRDFQGRLLLGCLGDGSAGWRGVLSGLAIASVVYTPEEVAALHASAQDGGFAAMGGARDLEVLYDFAKVEGSRDGVRYRFANQVGEQSLSDLIFPAVFDPLRPAIFGVPELRDMKADWFFADMIRNIAGFIPLGFLAALILLRHSDLRGVIVAFQVAALGASLSFGIEAVQIALPMRSSSLSDLGLNSFGAMAGAVIGLAFRHSRIARPG